MRVSILGSGSKGNCTLIASSRTVLMVDAGFSRRETLRRMQQVGESPDRVQALLISHEHSDHIRGLPMLNKHHRWPVYLNHGTSEALAELQSAPEAAELFVTGRPFTVGDIEVTAFTIPHDATDPVAFTFLVEGVRIAVVTDLGYMPENVKDSIRGADCLVLESNHDLDMLKVGPYPWSLKQRVMGRLGHLSNDGAAGFLQEGFDGRAACIVLAHLSENNNVPELARLCAEQALAARGLTPRVEVASQTQPLEPILF